MTAPQYASYHDVWKPRTIAAMRTIDRRKVFNMALAVGNSQMFIPY
jgi:serine/threonine protein kinase HipA of HipAB toxin-antitoxin module